MEKFSDSFAFDCEFKKKMNPNCNVTKCLVGLEELERTMMRSWFVQRKEEFLLFLSRCKQTKNTFPVDSSNHTWRVSLKFEDTWINL